MMLQEALLPLAISLLLCDITRWKQKRELAMVEAKKPVLYVGT